MKRKIKFRAWHKEEKILCEVTVLTDKGAFLLGVKSGEDQYFDGGKSVVKAPDDGRFCDNNEFEVMQYTGLLDNNGVEIYEGDILNKKTTFENNMADRRFQSDTEILVSFEDGCFIDENSGVALYEKMRTISSYRLKNWTDYEVIGNIYENLELL